MDLYLTWASNCNEANFPEYLVYFKSLKKFKNTADAVCLTNALEDRYRGELKQFCHVVQSETKIEWIVRDRFLAFWEYLCKHPEYNYVVLTDSRDVVFQGDPLRYMRGVSHRYQLALTSEGFSHRQSEFNLIDQFEHQRSVRGFDHNYFDWPVVNGGVILGTLAAVKNFCLMVWSNTVRSVSGTDQAAINYLYQYLKRDSECFLADPHTSVLSITGEAVKHQLLQFSPVYQNNSLCTTQGDPYLIFHQWDRTEFKESILRQYMA